MPDHPTHPDVRLLDGYFYAGDPYPTFRWMRANAPVYYDEAGSCWGLTLHEDVMNASKTPTVFCNRFGMRPDSPAIPSMINLDGKEHERRRNLVNKGFTRRRVEGQEDKIRGICTELIDRIAPLGRCDFVRDVAAPAWARSKRTRR